LSQRSPRVLLVELGPEQREQAVASVKTAGSGSSEVGQQREAPRLREESRRFSPLDREAQRPERPKLNHAGAGRSALGRPHGFVTASDGPVTLP